MILHTVNKSPYADKTLHSCLKAANDNDTLLLIEDGVYGALKEGEFSDLVDSAGPRIVALVADLEARGLMDRLLNSVDTVDYAGFVELTLAHDKVVSWF
jgi:tRNA 2-thiouridine synthesizing protein B